MVVKVKRKMSLLITVLASNFTGQITLHYRGVTEDLAPDEAAHQVLQVRPKKKTSRTLPHPEDKRPGGFPTPPGLRNLHEEEEEEEELEIFEPDPVLKRRACEDVFFKQLLTPVSPETKTETSVRLFDGDLIEVNVSTSDQIPSGALFVRIELISGSTSQNSTILHTLIQGTVTAIKNLSWIMNSPVTNNENEEYILAFNAGNGSPGGAFVEDFPDFVSNKLLSVKTTFTTSSINANRRVNLFLQTPTGLTYLLIPSNNLQGNNDIATYSFAPDMLSRQINLFYSEPIPPNLEMPPGAKISLQATDVQAGDQFTNVTIVVKRKFEGVDI